MAATETQVQESPVISKQDDEKIMHEESLGSVQGEQSTPKVPEDDVVTIKTWVVVIALATCYAFSYSSIPGLAITQGQIATQFGEPDKATWIISVYSIAGLVAFMLCGPNSDLFGRRWFLIAGNLFVVVGGLLAGTAKSFNQVIAGMAIAGFGGGNCQMAVFAGPELLPNKWRPAAVFLADSAVIIACIVGPVAGRVALLNGTWFWLMYASVIGNGIGAIILFLLYFPPKHPRGLPWHQAVRELDYIGGLLFTAGATLILVGVVFASYKPSSDPKVIGTLVSGFAGLIGFGCWETWAPLKQPLTPSALFRHNRGQTLTAPFIVTFMVPIYYLGTNIVFGQIVDNLLTTPESPKSLAMELSIIQGLGMLTGGTLLSSLGAVIKRWKWSQLGSVTLMTLFGGLLALARPDRRALLIACNFLGSAAYGWAQYLSIAYCQFGAPQEQLGIVGGLAGVARFGGNCIASTVYVTILQSTVTKTALKKVVAAVMSAGGSRSVGEAVLAALPFGSKAVQAVPGVTSAIVSAADAAYQESHIAGIRTVALASIAFGGLGMVACLWCEDITPKMNNNIEIFLENDVQAGKNKYH